MMRSAKTIKHLFLAAFVLFLAYYSMHSRSNTSAARASVAMLDVGQGDSILIALPGGRQLLIDGGKDDRVLAELSRVMPRGDRSIDVVIATHPDADHIGGLPLVLDRYQVGLLLAPNVVTESEVADELYRVIAAKGIPAYYARRGMNLTLDPSLSATLRILFPDRETVGWETNAASVVARLSVGERSALFTGDAPQSIETYLASIGSKEIDVDV